jgi:phosphoglucosamine mutase
MLLGPMPTPAIAYLTKTFRGEAGVVISASHNPYYDNGIKFFSNDGQKLPDEIELAIEAELDKPMSCVSSDKLGKATRINDAAGRYIEFCKSNFPSQLSLSGLKIVVDCANGATYHIAPNVFRELGAEVIVLAAEPDGININEQCGATSMAMISKAVVEHKADLGIALDGDGDRLMMVDHTGYIIDGDEAVFIIANNDLKTGNMCGGVVGTQMSNMGLELALADLGIPFARSNVGDRYVMEMLKQNKWSLGAENSGHIINLKHTSTGDGIIAALNVLTAVCQTGESLYQLRQGMSKLPQILVNVRLTADDFSKNDPCKADNVIAAVHQVNEKLNGQGRVLLRKSGTEPLIRVMVEGSNANDVEAHANEIADAVKKAC